MIELTAKQVSIQGGFWGPRLVMNAQKAIDHQWKQLERTGCIQNFRLVAEKVEGIREGYFFADSDAYKWLDAAARVYASHPSTELYHQMDEFIDLIQHTQTGDGYIYTYNQLIFPDVRWQNLQIEHELYCHGHLIEAAVSHFEATSERILLEVAIKAADLLVRDFSGAGPEATPGHQEIEIALIKLYRCTGQEAYLLLAEQFIEQRGRIKPFITHILENKKSHEARATQVEDLHAAYLADHPEHREHFQLPPDNVNLKPPWGKQRQFLNQATGKYFQQHKPVRQQSVPVGHAVRFAYLETAIAMLHREHPDESLRKTLEKTWDHMVSRRMYVTGGTGALPNIEGFGRDYELDPFYSYSETCAALGLIFWNGEMTQISGDARYADLTEWLLYNAAAVGLGQDGTSYLYNNPLACRGEVTRQAWYKCPCCPSNISRTWADLGRTVASTNGEDVWVHQYISSSLELQGGCGLTLDSGLPWDGDVSLTLAPVQPAEFSLHLRIPSWSTGLTVRVNGESAPLEAGLGEAQQPKSGISTASGYDPRTSRYLPLKRTWSPGDRVDLAFEMGIQLLKTHPKVRPTRRQVAITRGPLVYCLESIDNPGVDVFNAQLDPASLHAEHREGLFDGVTVLRGTAPQGFPLTFIPYYLWANRGESRMTVYVRTP